MSVNNLFANMLQHPDTGKSAYEYTEEICGLLKGIHDLLSEQQSTEETLRQRYPFGVQLDGSGNGNQLINIPQGFDWSLEAISVAGLTQGVLSIYNAPSADPSFLIRAVPGAAASPRSESISDSYFLNPNNQAFLVVTGGPVSGVVGGNFTIQTIREKKPKRAMNVG